VTHDPRTIPYADRVIEIEDGQIIGQKKGGEGQQAAARDKKVIGVAGRNSQKRKQYASA